MVAKKIGLLAIVGPTACGKTALAIDIALRYNGEIVAADSRTIFRGMDIGTAKPSLIEQCGVMHWGFDLVAPDQKFSVADFKLYANEKTKDILSRGHIPILVGGSGLYIDAVLYDFKFAPVNQILRDSLEKLDITDLQKLILVSGLKMPENGKNKRYLIRTLERGTAIKLKKPLANDNLIIGINPDRTELAKRISLRARQMIDSGVIDEIECIVKRYGWESEAMTASIYKAYRPYLEGRITQKEAIDNIIVSDLRLAKKQMTWFRRNKDINWFKDTATAKTWLDQQFKGKLI